MANQPPRDRRAEVEAWWALIARILAFVFGTQLIVYTAVFMQDDPTELRVFLAMGGFAMTGPVIATSLSQILGAARGAGRE